MALSNIRWLALVLVVALAESMPVEVPGVPCKSGACSAASSEAAEEAAEEGLGLLQIGQQKVTDASDAAAQAGEKKWKPKCTCPPKGFDTQGALEGGFDLDWYVSDTWYVQQQMVVQYLPADRFLCVTADYDKLDSPTAMGYDIKVNNRAQNASGAVFGNSTSWGVDTGLGAKVVDAAAGKLKVAPLFLPTFFAGPYWVVAFNVQDGWAVVSGGPPKIQTEDGCKTGDGTNGSGLWIFSRQRQAPAAHVAAARAVAKAKGFDLSVLKIVDQSNC